jgi:sulfate adenylyltransferase subunit 2
MTLSHLDRLEGESIHILREVAAQAERPVLLYSAGKDSSVLLHLARKAFYPAAPPFPLLHVDTGWKFASMYALRDKAAAEAGMTLIVHRNPEAERLGINPLDHGSERHTRMWKTDGLKQALNAHRFDAAIGGARRDEEKSRAKERIFSFRAQGHRWDPKNQRPELWRLYNARMGAGESFRAFPISNWTETDVWSYVEREGIEVSDLYFAAERPVIARGGMLLMVDDARLAPSSGEVVERRSVRFRTLGCYPLTGAVESRARTVADILAETRAASGSEREGRAIDHDEAGSMEKKKIEGYF